MIEIDEILKSIKSRVRDNDQETRIRDLYVRTSSAYQTDHTRGIRAELEVDWNKLKKKFEAAADSVKKETGTL